MNNKYCVAESINSKVNAETTYSTDADNYGEMEYWTEALNKGDCEDYALKKRAMLLEMGWGLDSLLLCTCKTETGEGHCVLWVDTDKGGYILDNRYHWPMSPSALPYEWQYIMKGGKWHELSGWQ